MRKINNQVSYIPNLTKNRPNLTLLLTVGLNNSKIDKKKGDFIMKKVILTAFILSILCLFALNVSASERVEITFCVGESTLSINGEDVTVEKPYIAGEGVTLVPLRVITEAFGASVEWIADTKSVVMTGEGKNIVLQINNPDVWVDEEKSTLLAPPELTQNGFTMVPLRFISETFGASVTYDEATKRITVTKEKGNVSSWNIKDSGGKSIFYSEKYGFEIAVTAGSEFISKADNEIILQSSDENINTWVTAGIYSKDKVISATKLARTILEENKNKYNSGAVTSDTDITKTTFKGFEGCEYRSDIHAAALKADFYGLFFEKGEYVYSIGIFYDKTVGESFKTDVLNSIVVKELNFAEIGSLERAKEETKEPFIPEGIGKCTITLPGDFTAAEEGVLRLKTKDELKKDEKLFFNNGKISFDMRRIVFDKKDWKKMVLDSDGYLTLQDFKRIFSYYGGFRTETNTEITQHAKKVKIGDNYMLKMLLTEEDDGYICYHELFIGENDDDLYVFSASYPEIHYSNDNRELVLSIVATLKYE